MKKALSILGIIVAALVVWWAVSANKTDNGAENNNQNQNQNQQDSLPAAGEDVPNTHTITYNGTAFSPSQLTVKTGDTVNFVNNSSRSFWPASGPHPQHTNYPEFDPKQGIATGEHWSFTFTKVGSWPFHDHLNATVFGRIVVE